MPGQEGSELAPQRDEAESALERVTKDGSLMGSSSSRRLSDSAHLRHSGEEGSLLNQDEEDDEDDNHAFAESIRRDTGELPILKDGLTQYTSFVIPHLWDLLLLLHMILKYSTLISSTYSSCY